jgi:4-hydroxy-tetrahydrodipicolinate synthase
MTNAWPASVSASSTCAAEQKFAERTRSLSPLTPAFHLDTHVKLVQYIKMAEHLVYGAPEWTRAPRLPLIGEEREQVRATIQDAIDALTHRSTLQRAA